jgi:superfamily II DNA or RNA helicase
VPEVRVAVAYGRMPPSALEDVMAAFYDGKFDVLLSTAIVESGLDIPTANTLIVHGADMFGLAQIYQLRGRVGRAKMRAYALLTLPSRRKITPQAERRLKVLQSLDTLGAGFQLASHDLDIRGAGKMAQAVGMAKATRSARGRAVCPASKSPHRSARHVPQGGAGGCHARARPRSSPRLRARRGAAAAPLSVRARRGDQTPGRGLTSPPPRSAAPEGRCAPAARG